MVSPIDIVGIILAAAIVISSVLSYRDGQVNSVEALANIALLGEAPILLFLVIGEAFDVVPTGYVTGSLVVVLLTILVGAGAWLYGERKAEAV